MLKKFFRWSLLLLGVFLLLLSISAVALTNYLRVNQHRMVRDLSLRAGLDVTYRQVDLTAWRNFPRVSIDIDSLVVRDLSRPLTEPPLLAAAHLGAGIYLGNLWNDSLGIERFSLSEGGLYLAGDSTGQLNLGELASDRETASEDTITVARSLLNPVIDWQGVTLSLRDFDLTYLLPTREKDLSARVDTFFTTADLTPEGALRFDSRLRAQVHGLGFKTSKGYYLQDAGLSGDLEVLRHDSAWVLAPTALQIAGDTYQLSGALGRAEKRLSLTVENSATHYDRSLALLTGHIREKLERYHVEGTFPARAEITDHPDDPEKARIYLSFQLDDQNVRLRQHRFRRVTTAGTLVNRLPEAEGGLPGSKKNIRIEVGPTVVYQDGMRVESPGGIVRGTERDIWMEAPLTVSGPAATLSRRLGNQNFVFDGGRFLLETDFNSTLLNQETMIARSDGELHFHDLDVRHAASGSRFPVRDLTLTKQRKDVGFRLQSAPLPSGLEFAMEGEIDNLLPLLLDRPADSMRTDVRLSAPYLSWTDYLALFGDDGMFADDAPAAEVPPPPGGGPASMKRTLLDLRRTFRPRIRATFDTLAYYDVLTLANFSTGLHFERDTLVLEDTRFDWENGELQFGARLGLANPDRTPFGLMAHAEHLDLEALRPTLRYFGLQLPEGLDSLPTDLGIDFMHQGVINDSFGIQPGFNRGELAFNDGAGGLFTGSIRYLPEPGGLRSAIHLEGDPVVVNRLFAAESFFFGSGRFRIDLNTLGTPTDLGELVRTSSLRLSIDSSRVIYQPAGVYVPIRSFLVSAENDRVDYDLRLTSDATRRSVGLTGTLDSLTAFLYPQPGRRFTMRAAASASRLHASDLEDFIRQDTVAQSSATDPTDTTDLRQLLSATGGIFASFRPDLSLQIDTFAVDSQTTVTGLHTGLRLRDSTQLILEPSGFELGAGSVRFSGDYNLDRRVRSPFSLRASTDSLDLRTLRRALTPFTGGAMSELGDLAGRLDLILELDGKLHEGRQEVMMDSTRGQLHLRLTDAELREWPAVRAMGKKAKMEKRFAALRLAPLDLLLQIDSGRIVIPETELQSTAIQLFIEGRYDTVTGPDLLIAFPLRNIGRGLLEESPAPTGFAAAGWKVYLVMEPDKHGVSKMKFRLGRRRYYRERGRLPELRERKRQEREARRRLPANSARR